MKNYKTSPEIIVVGAYERCSFTKGSKLKDLTEKSLVLWIGDRPWEDDWSLLHGARFECIYIIVKFHYIITIVGGGSVAEWSARRTRNPAVPGSSPALPLAGFVLGRPEFKFSATLVNSQLVAFCQLGFLILLCCI